MPAASLDAVLRLTGRRVPDVVKFVLAESDAHLPDVASLVGIDHYHAHAAGAFFTSPFERAAVLVCDRHSHPPITAWSGGPEGLHDCGWEPRNTVAAGPGLAALYTHCVQAFGFAPGQEYQLEALARLDPGESADRLSLLMGYSDRVVGLPNLCVGEADAVSIAVGVLRRGHLVGWFQGRMGGDIARSATGWICWYSIDSFCESDHRHLSVDMARGCRSRGSAAG